MGCKYIVSIIIPVYNAEKYINNCINSVLGQTYKNIELILVDDGSTDSSGFICDEYAKKDYRVRVIHQENFGPSVARNTGIIVARGTYIQFVDSDDSLESNMIYKLVDAMKNNVQLTICGYKSIKKNKRKTIIQENNPFIQGIYQYNEFIEHLGELYKDSLINSPCNKLYVSEIIKKYKIYFIEDLKMGEDLLFNLNYIKVCKYISIINDSLYNYSKFNNASLTTSFKKDLFENQQMLFQKVRAFLMDNNSYKGENKFFVGVSYTNSIINCLDNLFHKDSDLTSNDIKEQLKLIIFNERVKESIVYFKEGNIKKQLIGYLIEKKHIKSIFWLFKLRNSFNC